MKLVKVILVTVIVGLLMKSCISINDMITTTGVSPEAFDKIPPKSKVIKVFSPKSTGELFDEVMQLARQKGLNISKYDKEYHYFLTEGTFNVTGHRMYVSILEEENGSQAIFKTEWLSGGTIETNFSTSPQSWELGAYKNGREDATYAFIVTYSIAEKIENGKIEFE